MQPVFRKWSDLQVNFIDKFSAERGIGPYVAKFQLNVFQA